MFVFPDWYVDWQTPERIDVSTSRVAVGIHGNLYDKRIGETESGVAIPDLPYHSDSHIEKFQTFISSYTIDSFFGSILDVAGISGWVRSGMTPLPLTTTTVNSLLPGIMQYYGAGQPVDVHF